jgi:hypothetical protein
MTLDTVRVGARHIPISTAEQWIAAYFDVEANKTAAKPYAYPAYDQLAADSDPNELDNGELLAATLLTPHFTTRAFLSLQDARPALHAALAAIPTDLDLTEAVANGTHTRLIHRFAQLLDGKGLAGVQLTILVKTLHRKRPRFIPLFDDRVKSCYWTKTGQSGYPMQRDRNRAESAFTITFAECVAADLMSQPAVWRHLASLAPTGVSELRLLDVLAWNAGG